MCHVNSVPVQVSSFSLFVGSSSVIFVVVVCPQPFTFVSQLPVALEKFENTHSLIVLAHVFCGFC